jgi:hypothetical protein
MRRMTEQDDPAEPMAPDLLALFVVLRESLDVASVVKNQARGKAALAKLEGLLVGVRQASAMWHHRAVMIETELVEHRQLAQDRDGHDQWARRFLRTRLERASHLDMSDAEDEWLAADRVLVECKICDGKHQGPEGGT